MEIVLTFLEGVLSFISPCLLPLIPVYLSFIIGDNKNNSNKFFRSIFFILGFTIIFVALGIFSGSIGSLIFIYKKYVDIIFGVFILFIGLNYLNIINLKFLNATKTLNKDIKVTSNSTAFLFGIFFAFGYTPCIGAFLGSALMMANITGSAIKGGLYLLFYSLGLGIPFILSALFFEKTKTISTFIKKHYKLINIISGCFLILIGLYTIFKATGGF